MSGVSESFPACYVCGAENASGLHVTFARAEDGGSHALYTARPEHVGWPEIIHGGLLFTLMDESVAWAVIFAGSRAVTAKAEVRFRAPAKVGMSLVVRGRVVESSRRILRVRAEIREADERGPVVAEMDAVMTRVPEEPRAT